MRPSTFHRPNQARHLAAILSHNDKAGIVELGSVAHQDDETLGLRKRQTVDAGNLGGEGVDGIERQHKGNQRPAPGKVKPDRSASANADLRNSQPGNTTL